MSRKSTPQARPLIATCDVSGTVRAEGAVHDFEVKAGPVPDDLPPAVLAYLVEFEYVTEEGAQ